MKGQCLCQAVTIETAETQELHACHCNNCRKWNGGGSAFSFQAQGIDIIGKEHIKSYQLVEWGTRNFCQNCGTNLFFHQTGTDNYFVSAGLFDQQAFKLATQFFIDKKASYYELANDTPKLTEAQIIAMYENDGK
ncbi:GFA family protein [Moraxella nasovis]|uniref:GFA family protein n=1 Tax=Moraxella nasovis TaxID=2904121 RepID=UPI001F603CF5|nr:GFA family protein [Moraxella nasovis]UNU73046.1 GFA family protein [Moraxella nasovis]